MENRNEEIVALVRERTLNLYRVHRLCCSESVILVMNQAFSGGLSPEMAVRIGSGFCGGMGAGGTCGGLGGAMVVLGLFVGPGTSGWPGKKKFRLLCRQLYDGFAEVSGSSSCRELTHPFAGDRRSRAENCGNLIVLCAELVCRMVLIARPELAESCDFSFLKGREGRFEVILKKILGRKSYLAES